MKQILAFGDSNTWGLIPGTWDRYPEHIRWTGILRKAVLPLGFRILEDGVCGRTTVFDDPGRPLRRGIDSIPRYKDIEGISLVILMLGVVSPILLGPDVWKPEKDPAFDQISIDTCAELKNVYQAITQKRGNAFLAASDYARASSVDDEHLNAEGHELFAAAIIQKVRQLILSAA